MTLVIMAAGMGSRYGGLKQIDPIGPGGEFIVDYSVYDAVQAGFTRVVFIIKEENLALFKESVGARLEKHVPVEYVFQRMEDIPAGFIPPTLRTKPWGTGHAVYSCRNTVKEPFAVINADDFYGRDSFLKLAAYLKNPDSSAKEKEHFCMAGFILENTLTEHGSVSRGVCKTDKAAFLTDVTERTKIQKNNDQAEYFENGIWTPLSSQATVSMNCWGFTPAFFPRLEKELAEFLRKNNNNLDKSEFFLPFVVHDLINSGFCDVKVLKTSAKWYGVTYREDKPLVSARIREMIAAGKYPAKLWA